MLSFTLQAVVCQTLIPRAQGKGRALAVEILVANSAVRALIRDDKSHQIASNIQTGSQVGMRTLNQSVYELYRAGAISYEEANTYAPDPNEFQRLIQRPPKSGSAGTKTARRATRLR